VSTDSGYCVAEKKRVSSWPCRVEERAASIVSPVGDGCSFVSVNQVLVRPWARRRCECLTGILREGVPATAAKAFRGVGSVRRGVGVCVSAALANGILLCAERVAAVSGGIRWMVPAHGGWALSSGEVSSGEGPDDLERKKGIRWMPWHQEAMKDVARCEKPWGAASRR
jgi:hypothetical protein